LPTKMERHGQADAEGLTSASTSNKTFSVE